MRLRGAAIAAGLVLIAALAAARAQAPEAFRLKAISLPLDVDRPKRTRLGALTYAGGLALSARGTSHFGGFSGIDVSEDGRFLAQSDAGDLLTGRLALDATGRLTGVAEPTLSRLTDERGVPYPDRKVGADAEDITLLPGGGYAIAYEGRHRVLAYGPDGSVRRLGMPAGVEGLYANTGLEALATWTDGTGRPRLVEGLEDGRAWSCDMGGQDCQPILGESDAPAGGFRLTGLDALPDREGMVAVYRSFDLIRGFRAVIAWVRPGTAHPVTELARLEPPYTVDNMEGIAAVARPDGSIRLYLISDDNFLNLQRTLLLAFDWKAQTRDSE